MEFKMRTYFEDKINPEYKGVYYKKSNNKWIAEIQLTKEQSLHLGYFDNIEEAIEIRQEAIRFYDILISGY